MDMPVVVWVLSLIGAAIAGFVACRASHRRTSRDAGDEQSRTAERLHAVELELDDAIHRSRRELQRSNRLAVERDEARAEVDALRADLHAAEQRRLRDEDRIVVAERKADEFQKRFSDIVGLENEIASLRVIAARVPGLERRLAEQCADDEIIDLRESQPSERAG